MAPRTTISLFSGFSAARVRSVRNIARPYQFPYEGSGKSPAHFDRSLRSQVARVELQRNIAFHEFVAAIAAANGIVDRNVSRASVRYQLAHRPVALANPRCAHGAGDR